MNVASPEILLRIASFLGAHASVLLMVSDPCSSFIVPNSLRTVFAGHNIKLSLIDFETIFHPLSTLYS